MENSQGKLSPGWEFFLPGPPEGGTQDDNSFTNDWDLIISDPSTGRVTDAPKQPSVDEWSNIQLSLSLQPVS